LSAQNEGFIALDGEWSLIPYEFKNKTRIKDLGVVQKESSATFAAP
jgi:hypothetical protein